jgi:predicted transglutaminase-like cysteine proteinase
MLSKFDRWRGLALGIAASLPALSCLSIASSTVYAASQPVSSVRVGGPTSVPFGWADFCRRYPGECNAHPVSPSSGNAPVQPEKMRHAKRADSYAPTIGSEAGLGLTARTIKRIERINRWVNANVEAVSDAEQWGVIDRWDYPVAGKGDCEDFVLLKRRLLIEAGFPREALLITVVKDARNEGHAVLTVKTDAGDLILDNLNNEVKPWDKTGYLFVKRQSEADPNIWVQLGEPTSEPDYVSR